MTCAKKVVKCKIISATGMEYHGENSCLNPQAVCPRTPGEGYEKCTSVCNQQGHAEIQALKAAGSSARGGVAIIDHSYACRHCQETLFEAGIEWIKVTQPRKKQV